MNRWAILSALLVAAVTATIPADVLAQDQEEEGEKLLFAEPKKNWKWDEDKRFDFLMERLASLEASLDAIDRAIAKASGKRGSKLGEARRAEAGNSAMDRKGGGPMKWNEFYGTTAEKFFYHPVDPSTTYHTNTVLRQMGSDQDDKLISGIPSNQSVPAHQRPPQFDYIYRANHDAKQRAESEAAAIQGQLDALLERREKLETEQADLWCRLAFRAIQRLNIPRRPELRFRLVAASTEPADDNRAVVLEAAARFLASALLILEKADEDQATALGNIRKIVTNARKEFDDVLLANAEVSSDSADREKPLGQFTALAQLLDDTSNNLSESYQVAIDGSRAKDAARENQFRGLLQRSLIEYAQIVMALDESLRVLKVEWNVAVDTKHKVEPLTPEWPLVSPNTTATPSSGDTPSLDREEEVGREPSRKGAPQQHKGPASRGSPKKKHTARETSVLVPEPRGLSEQIRERLPTVEEIEILRNSVSLPRNTILEVKSRYMNRINTAFPASEWSPIDVLYLARIHASLSGITGETSLQLPEGQSSGDGQGQLLVRSWILHSPNEKQFVQNVLLLDRETRQWIDRTLPEDGVKKWLDTCDPPLKTPADKARALDFIIRSGVLCDGVVRLRRTLQASSGVGR